MPATAICLLPRECCESPGSARIVAKEQLTIAGLDVARRVFQRLDPGLDFEAQFKDGDAVARGSVVVRLSGRLAALLK